MSDVYIRIDGVPFHVEVDDDGSVRVDGFAVPVHVREGGTRATVTAGDQVFAIDTRDARTLDVDGARVPVHITGLQGVAGAPDPTAGAYGPIHPPMIGKLVEVHVKAGATVAAGDVLFVLEAMKMRNEVKAGAAGVVAAVHATAGSAVDPKQAIVTLAAAS